MSEVGTASRCIWIPRFEGFEVLRTVGHDTGRGTTLKG